MLNLKTLIQSLIDTTDLVTNVHIGNKSRYCYVLQSDLNKVYQLDTGVYENCYEIEDKLAKAAILDLPVSGAGYIRSGRFCNEPLFLITDNVLIPYGRLLVWNSWFLEVLFKKEACFFTKVKGTIPFEKITNKSMNVEECLNEMSETPILNFFKKVVVQQNFNKKDSSDQLSKFITDEIKRQFNDEHLSPTFLDHFDQNVLNLLLSENDEYLETLLSPVENVQLCFYLYEKIACFLSKRGLVVSLIMLRLIVSLLMDLGLKNDFARSLDIPIESMRQIALGIEAQELRSRDLSWLKGSYLQKVSLYHMCIQIKNEDWSELVKLLAQDKINQTIQRLDTIYCLFLTQKKETQFFYVTYLSSILERGRLLVSRNPNQKGDRRQREISSFIGLLFKFRSFIIDVAGKSGFESKLTFQELNDFFNIYQKEMYEMLDIFTQEDLLQACWTQLEQKD